MANKNKMIGIIRQNAVVILLSGVLITTGKAYYSYGKDEVKKTVNEEISKSDLSKKVSDIETKVRIHDTMLVSQTKVLKQLLNGNQEIKREQMIANNILCKILPEYKDYKSITANKINKDTSQFADIIEESNNYASFYVDSISLEDFNRLTLDQRKQLNIFNIKKQKDKQFIVNRLVTFNKEKEDEK